MPCSLTIKPGLPRRATSAVSFHATRHPDRDVSATAARHSFVTSSITLKIRNRRPWAKWSWTKSTDQRAFGAATFSSGAHVPATFLRPRLLRTDYLLERRQPLRVRHIHPDELGFPGVERGAADSLPTAELRRLLIRFLLAQDADDLFLGELRSLHGPFLSLGRTLASDGRVIGGESAALRSRTS